MYVNHDGKIIEHGSLLVSALLMLGEVVEGLGVQVGPLEFLLLFSLSWGLGVVVRFMVMKHMLFSLS